MVAYTDTEFDERKHKRSALGTFAEKPAAPKARISLATSSTQGDLLERSAAPQPSQQAPATGGRVGETDPNTKQPKRIMYSEAHERAMQRKREAEERRKRMEARRQQLRDRAARARGEPLDRDLFKNPPWTPERIKAAKDRWLWTVQDNTLEQNIALFKKLGWPVGKAKDGHTYVVTPWGTRYRSGKPKKGRKKAKPKYGFWHGFTSPVTSSAAAILRERVHGNGLTAASPLSLGEMNIGDWDPSLHPRGRDGKFIDVLGWVRGRFVLPSVGVFNTDRSKVIGFARNDKDPNDPYVVVEKNGQRAYGLASNAQQVSSPKGRLEESRKTWTVSVEQEGLGEVQWSGTADSAEDAVQQWADETGRTLPADPLNEAVDTNGDGSRLEVHGDGGSSLVIESSEPRDAAFDGTVSGRDGVPIEAGQKIELVKMHGFQHGQRGKVEVEGEVVGVNEDGTVTVGVTDERWEPTKFGATFEATPDQVQQAGYKGDKKPKPTSPAPKKEHYKTPSPKNDTGKAPPRTTLTFAPSPDGPNFPQLKTPDDWFDRTPEKRLEWLKETMEADFTEWRGKPTTIDFTGYDSGIALNLANTYRDLANWDPDTSKRIDKFIPGTMGTGNNENLGFSAIAVANPGTAHPGGIGPKIADSAIVFKESYFQSMSHWHAGGGHGGGMPWSTSEFAGDPTITLVHEFGHQRQFRFLDIAMSEVGQAWSPTVMSDGFGLIPDSSNWPETQAIRYEIPKATPTQYGHSKSSEGFAEAWASRAIGQSSPELNALLDQWDAYMGLALVLPKERYKNTTAYELLDDAGRDEFWKNAGPMLDLPGMREHYPESAAAYDAWANTQGAAA